MSEAFSTPRLLLREFRSDDLEPVYALWSDPLVTRWTDYSIDTWHEAEDWLETIRYCDAADPRFAYNFAVVLRESGTVVGWIGVAPPSRAGAPAGELDLGFCLRREYWKRGLMTEAVCAVLDFAFARLRARRIFAQCHPENLASARVMEKAGMRFEGLLPTPGGDGEVRDYRRYSIDAADGQGSGSVE